MTAAAAPALLAEILFPRVDPVAVGPGDPLGTVLGPFTMGQMLSGLMLVVGAGILVRAWQRDLLRPSGQH